MEWNRWNYWQSDIYSLIQYKMEEEKKNYRFALVAFAHMHHTQHNEENYFFFHSFHCIE